MGNSKSKQNKLGLVLPDLSNQPGQPRVSLAHDRMSPFHAENTEAVSDEVVLNWSPCTKNDKGYDVEMWDLGLQEWVHVASTEIPELTLSNILSGILYRFRVTAVTAEGSVSFPSDPSEPFVIDIPGVQIAPYWIQTPPTIMSLTVNQPLQLSAAALGTPAPNFHWYKDDEELFIRHNLTIEATPDGSQLTILRADPTDGGTYTCTAVNTVGKTSWESTVDLKCKPIFELPILFEKPISFQLDELMSLKVPLIAVPEPNLVLEKLDKDDEAIVEATFTSNPSLDEPVHKDSQVRISYRDNFAVIKIESAQKWHTGRWRLTASNPIGTSEVGLHFLVRSEPDPPPEAPEVEEISEESGTVTLTWQSNHEDAEVYGDIQYQVEYNRETWDIWLKGSLTKQLSCKLTDLFPGSYYRFRVRTVCKSGISEPSIATDRIFIGRPQEDEVFGLPGGNYPKEMGHQSRNLFQYGSGIKHSKKFSSLKDDIHSTSSSSKPTVVTDLDKAHAVLNNLAKTLKKTHSDSQEQLQQQAVLPEASEDRGSKAIETALTGGASDFPQPPRPQGRKLSLDRDVYYFENNRREEVVAYDNQSAKAQLGNLATERGLSRAEQATYKSSLGDLCAKLMTASRTSLNNNNNQTVRNSKLQPQAQPPTALEAEQPPSFQEYTPRSRSESVASGRSGRSDSIASRRGMTPGDEAIFNKSMGDLASKLMGASRGHLAHKPVRGSVDNVYKPSQHLSRSNSQPSRPKSGLKRYSSLEEATEHEKELIRTSLTDLCFRLKSVSRESSLARGSSLPPGMMTSRYSSSSSIASGMTGPPPLTPASQRLRQQLSLPDPEPSEYEDTEAHEAAVEADLQHSASTVTVLEKRIGTKEQEEEEEEEEEYEEYDEEEEEDEKPLGTSSPIPSFIQQPQQLSLNPDHYSETSEVDETETYTETDSQNTDPFLQTQIKQRETLLHSQPYFTKTAVNNSSNNNTIPTPPPRYTNNNNRDRTNNNFDYQPSLSTIASVTTNATEKTLVASPSLSSGGGATSRTLIASPSGEAKSRTLIASPSGEEGTLKGQASFESDIGDSSRTILGHNDTFDNCTDIDELQELSFDH